MQTHDGFVKTCCQSCFCFPSSSSLLPSERTRSCRKRVSVCPEGTVVTLTCVVRNGNADSCCQAHPALPKPNQPCSPPMMHRGVRGTCKVRRHRYEMLQLRGPCREHGIHVPSPPHPAPPRNAPISHRGEVRLTARRIRARSDAL